MWISFFALVIFDGNFHLARAENAGKRLCHNMLVNVSATMWISFFALVILAGNFHMARAENAGDLFILQFLCVL